MPEAKTATHGHPHPQDVRHHDHECPEHYHRCHATFHGYIDCPVAPHVKPMKTVMVSVACGVDDPKPQIQSFLSQPANARATVAQVLDLNHDGWLVIYNVPE